MSSAHLNYNFPWLPCPVPPPRVWTPWEEALLSNALMVYPEGTPYRWSLIALQVSHRSPAEVFDHYMATISSGTFEPQFYMDDDKGPRSDSMAAESSPVSGYLGQPDQNGPQDYVDGSERIEPHVYVDDDKGPRSDSMAAESGPVSGYMGQPDQKRPQVYVDGPGPFEPQVYLDGSRRIETQVYDNSPRNGSMVAEYGPVSGYLQQPDAKEKVIKRAPHWTIDEHKAFLQGVKIYGWGKWKKISRHSVFSKTNIQVASHAQKFDNHKKTKSDGIVSKRKTIHDITTL